MEAMITIPGFSEPVSSISHLLGAVFFFVLFIMMLVRHHHSPLKVVAIAIFAFSSIFLLSMSGVYHLLDPLGAGRVVLQRLDHAAIFVLIAGTFTAVHMVLARGIWRWGMIALVWIISTTGITLKTIYFVDLPEAMGLAIYISFGWLGLASAAHLWKRYGYQTIKPLIYGGVAYSTGAVLDFLQQPVLISGVFGPHEVFHIAILAGIGYHWRFVDQAFFHSQYTYTFTLKSGALP